MNFDQIIPIIYMIGVLILVLPSFLHSNSKLKQFLANLSVWVIIVLIVTTVSYFLFKQQQLFQHLSAITLIPVALVILMIFSVFVLSGRENITEFNNSLENISNIENLKQSLLLVITSGVNLIQSKVENICIKKYFKKLICVKIYEVRGKNA